MRILLLALAACSLQPPGPVITEGSEVVSPPETCEAVGPHLLNAGTAEVPMEVHGLAGVPMVEVEMGGESLWFIVDTGASHNGITEGVAKRLGLSTTPVEVGAAGGPISGGITSATLRVGEASFDDTSVVVVPDEALHQTMLGFTVFHADGILGWPILGAGRTTLDPRRGRLTLAPSSPTSLRDRFVWDQAPVVGLSHDAGRGGVIVDTGAGVTLIEESLAGPWSLGESYSIPGGLGAEPITIRMATGPIELHSLGRALRFETLEVASTTTGPPGSCAEGALGMDVLGDVVLVIDGPTGSIQLGPT